MHFSLTNIFKTSRRDNLRGFFEQCFAPLVARIFGYSGASWLGQVARSGKEADARALSRLLSPSGPLFTAVYNADADGSIRFHFPRQRLPAHTQMLLAAPAGIKSLATWPQYGTSVEDNSAASKGHIHVSVFQYFCYWFAFYAIKGDNLVSNAGLGGASAHSGFGSQMRRAADALHLTRGRDADPALRNPYIALLRQMLVELVPKPSGPSASPMASPRRGANAVGTPASPYYRPSSGKRGVDAGTRGLVFYSTLLEFWLKDADEPVAVVNTEVPGRVQRGGAGGGGMLPPSPVAPLWATSYEPPSEDLLEAVGEIIRYATMTSTPPPRGKPAGTLPIASPAQAGLPWLPMTPVLNIQTSAAVSAGRSGAAVLNGPPRLGAAAKPGTQALSRQLFRFFHRAFAMWPDQRTIKPLLRAFLSFVAPWRGGNASSLNGSQSSPQGALASHLTAHVSELVHRVSRADAARGTAASPGVLLGTNGAAASGSTTGVYTPEWESHVLSNLPFYLELFPLFLERSISRVSVRGETAVHDVLTVMSVLESSPALLELLRSVERDFNRCAASQPRRAEGPFAELLPWLIDQAHDWQVAATANAVGGTPATSRVAPSYVMFAAARDRCAGLAAKDLMDLSASMLKPDDEKRLRRCLERVLPLAELAELAEVAPAAATNAAVAGLMDDAPRLPRSTWRDVKYRGDPLHRPVASFEIGPLVRVLVGISEKANAALGLDRRWEEGEEPAENRIQDVLVSVRKRGYRVNLRPMADVRNLFWIPVAFWTLRLLLRIIWLAITAIAAGIEENSKIQNRSLNDN